MKKLILWSGLLLAYSSVASQGGIQIVKPLVVMTYNWDEEQTMVPGIIKIDFTGNTSAQLGFSPAFSGTKMISCESEGNTFLSAVPITITNGAGVLPCKLMNYKTTPPPYVIRFKIGPKVFRANLDITHKLDPADASVNAFDGAAPVVDVSNPAQIKITLTEGNLYQAEELLASYAGFHYSIRYNVSGTTYEVKGQLSGPYSITDGGTVEIVLGQDIADIAEAADADSVDIIGYFLGNAEAGKMHRLLTPPIRIN
jgi:hypothetical protein